MIIVVAILAFIIICGAVLFSTKKDHNVSDRKPEQRPVVSSRKTSKESNNEEDEIPVFKLSATHVPKTNDDIMVTENDYEPDQEEIEYLKVLEDCERKIKDLKEDKTLRDFYPEQYEKFMNKFLTIKKEASNELEVYREKKSIRQQLDEVEKKINRLIDNDGVSSKQKGNDFEAYMADIMKLNGIRINQWNQGLITDSGAFADNIYNPDFLGSHQVGDRNLKYWIECKYRSKIPEMGFFLDEKQVTRYKVHQGKTKLKVFIAIGTGGIPGNPDRLYILPLNSYFCFDKWPERYLRPFLVETPELNMKKFMNDYFFNYVFKKKK